MEYQLQKRELHELEFEAWTLVTRFQHWIRREVFTSSTHPLQVTQWLSEMDKATSMQALDYAGLCGARKNFDTLYSPNAKDIMKIMYAGG